MIFVLVRELSTYQIIDHAEISINKNIDGELARVALLTRKQYELKYPRDKYYISFEEAEDFTRLLSRIECETNTQSIHFSSDKNTFRMEGTKYFLFIVNISGFILGAILLFILLVFRILYNPFIFIIGLMILGFYFVSDYIHWQKKGIQLIEIDSDGITFCRGTAMVKSRIDKKQITSINVFKKFKRRIVNIMLGGFADSSLPGVTLFSGSRIRITDDAFSEAEFGIFIQKLRELKPDQ